MASKTYVGKFLKGRKAVVVRADAATTELRCLDYFTPSFAWGYSGGAADELSIAILHDHLSATSTTFNERVLRLYRAFTEDVVSKFDHEKPWSLTEGIVARWVGARERAMVSA